MNFLEPIKPTWRSYKAAAFLKVVISTKLVTKKDLATKLFMEEPNFDKALALKIPFSDLELDRINDVFKIFV